MPGVLFPGKAREADGRGRFRGLPGGGAAAAKSLQSCLTLCDPTDGSPPGSPVPGVLQAGALEWAPLPSPSWWRSG